MEKLTTQEYLQKEKVAKIERMILEAGAVRCIIHNKEEFSPNIELLLLGTAMNFRTWFDRYLNYIKPLDKTLYDQGLIPQEEIDLSIKLNKFYKSFSDLMIGAFCSLDKLFYNKIAIQELGDESHKLLSSAEINALLNDMRSLSQYI